MVYMITRKRGEDEYKDDPIQQSFYYFFDNFNYIDIRNFLIGILKIDKKTYDEIVQEKDFYKLLKLIHDKIVSKINNIDESQLKEICDVFITWNAEEEKNELQYDNTKIIEYFETKVSDYEHDYCLKWKKMIFSDYKNSKKPYNREFFYLYLKLFLNDDKIFLILKKNEKLKSNVFSYLNFPFVFEKYYEFYKYNIFISFVKYISKKIQEKVQIDTIKSSSGKEIFNGIKFLHNNYENILSLKKAKTDDEIFLLITNINFRIVHSDDVNTDYIVFTNLKKIKMSEYIEIAKKGSKSDIIPLFMNKRELSYTTFLYKNYIQYFTFSTVDTEFEKKFKITVGPFTEEFINIYENFYNFINNYKALDIKFENYHRFLIATKCIYNHTDDYYQKISTDQKDADSIIEKLKREDPLSYTLSFFTCNTRDFVENHMKEIRKTEGRALEWIKDNKNENLYLYIAKLREDIHLHPYEYYNTNVNFFIEIQKRNTMILNEMYFIKKKIHSYTVNSDFYNCLIMNTFQKIMEEKLKTKYPDSELKEAIFTFIKNYIKLNLNKFNMDDNKSKKEFFVNFNEKFKSINFIKLLDVYEKLIKYEYSYDYRTLSILLSSSKLFLDIPEHSLNFTYIFCFLKKNNARNNGQDLIITQEFKNFIENSSKRDEKLTNLEKSEIKIDKKNINSLKYLYDMIGLFGNYFYEIANDSYNRNYFKGFEWLFNFFYDTNNSYKNELESMENKLGKDELYLEIYSKKYSEYDKSFVYELYKKNLDEKNVSNNIIGSNKEFSKMFKTFPLQNFAQLYIMNVAYLHFKFDNNK